jgi:hypothetical protein
VPEFCSVVSNGQRQGKGCVSVPALPAPTQLKPSSLSVREALGALVTGCGVIPRRAFFISDFPFASLARKNNIRPTARSFPYHAFSTRRLELRPLLAEWQFWGRSGLPTCHLAPHLPCTEECPCRNARIPCTAFTVGYFAAFCGSPDNRCIHSTRLDLGDQLLGESFRRPYPLPHRAQRGWQWRCRRRLRLPDPHR